MSDIFRHKDVYLRIGICFIWAIQSSASYSSYKVVRRTSKFIIMAYEKYLLLEIINILLFRMKYIVRCILYSYSLLNCLCYFPLLLFFNVFARSIVNIKYCMKRDITSLETCVNRKLSPVYSLCCHK